MPKAKETTLSSEKAHVVSVPEFKGVRYVVKPQKPNDDYEYVDGFAIWDQAEKRQVGWYQRQAEAEEATANKNDAEYIKRTQCH